VKTGELLSSLLLILFGTLFCRSSLHIGIGSISAPGPGLIPFGTGGLLILFSMGTIVEVLVTRKGAEKEGSTPLFSGRRWGVILAVLASLFTYALVLNVLGFLLATFLVLTILFKIPERQNWKGAIGMAALTTACTYALFAYALKCSLPSGILEFLGL
jgi:putative tricarboxylic transport membrane protein